MKENTKNFMALAFSLADQAATKGEIPVGAVIVDSKTNEIVASAHNLVETRQDPTAHAEMLALQQACQHFGEKRLSSCDLYVTLEPCPLCASAISLAKIRRLYYGAYDPKSGGVDHGPQIFQSKSCHHAPEIYSGFSETKARTQLLNFFQNLRHKNTAPKDQK